jgi:hypothetical protein
MLARLAAAGHPFLVLVVMVGLFRIDPADLPWITAV